MKLLCLTNLFPVPIDMGGAVRVRGLLRALSERHSLHVLALRRPETSSSHVSELSAELGAPVETFEPPGYVPASPQAAALWVRSLMSSTPPWVLGQTSEELAERALALAAESDATVILDDYAGVYVPRIVGSNGGRIVIADKHNVLSASTEASPPPNGRLRYRVQHQLALRMTRSYERRYLGMADAVVVSSDEEALRLRGLDGLEADAVVPSAIDLPPEPSPRAPGRIVGWLGSLDWRANVEGLTRFIEEGWEPLGRDGFELRVAGRGGPPALRELERFPGVRLVGYVDDLRTFTDELSMAVVPLWAGPGVKLKTLDLLGAGLPLAATTVGLEGLPAEHGRHCMIADDPRGLAEALAAIANDDKLADRLAAEGRRLVAEHFTWDRIGPDFVKVVERAVEGAPQ